MHVPVIQLAFGDASITTAYATSSGRPNRPAGNSWLTKSFSNSGFALKRFSQPPPGYRIEPGAIEFTRMFFGASSRASIFVNEIIAAFEVVYVSVPPASRPWIEL